ncbi:MAG: MFS transporter [Kordiimonadaceae bacterium]|nr:MFS transporter [Kordiimonadaceae bacterium]
MAGDFAKNVSDFWADLKGPDGKVYNGWWNILGCYPVIMFVFASPLVLLQFIYVDIENEYGLPRGDILTIATVKFAISAVVTFIAGIYVDRFGGKKAIYICGTVTGLGFMYWHFIGRIPGLDITTSIWLAGIPLGFSSMPLLMAAKTLCAKWLNKRLGLAMGILAAASSVNGILLTPFYAWLVETVGWRDALPVVSLAIFFIGFPVFYFFVDDNPTSAEIQCEFADAGDKKSTVKSSLLEADKSGKAPEFKEYAKKPNFIVICLVLLIIGFVDQGIGKNISFYIMNDLGFSKQEMAWSTVFSFVFGLASKLTFGWLFDKYSFKGITICYILIAISIALAFGVQGIATLYIFQMARGFTQSGVLVETPILAKHSFGPNHLGKMIGFFSAISAVGLAFGPRYIGMMHDYYGNYDYAFYLCIGLMIFCATVLYFLKPDYWLLLQKEKKHTVCEDAIKSNI